MHKQRYINEKEKEGRKRRMEEIYMHTIQVERYYIYQHDVCVLYFLGDKRGNDIHLFI